MPRYRYYKPKSVEERIIKEGPVMFNVLSPQFVGALRSHRIERRGKPRRTRPSVWSHGTVKGSSQMPTVTRV